MSNLRFASRSLARSPGFTTIAILTLALGIGMNTAMFSMLNGFLLRPLSFPHADRLFRLDRNSPQQTNDDHSALNAADIAASSRAIAELACFRYSAFTVTGDNKRPDVPVALGVSFNYFQVLGLSPVQGRGFLPEEDAAGKNNVIVLSHRYWQSRFNGAADVVGRTLKLDGTPVEIVGILPPDPDTVRIIAPVSLYRPLGLTDAQRAHRSDNNTGVIGRYRDGVTSEQAAAAFDVIGRRLAADHPLENGGMTLGVRSLQSTTLTGLGLNITYLLIGLSSFVLVISCANLANLLLARAISRAREFSIRAAVGGSRVQLLAPLVTECLVLAVAGGLAAMLVSSWTTDWLAVRFGSTESPVNFSPDSRVLAVGIGVSAATALLFGVAPAWWASHVPVSDALKAGGRGATGTRSQNRFRQMLIVTQFALALVLLTGAGIFVRGLQRVLNSKIGWNPDTVIAGTLNLASPTRFGSAAPIIAFHAQLRDKLLALPGVENASVSFETPLFDAPSRRNYLVEGREPPPPGHEIGAFTNGVSASFLDTMGMHLLRGRFIDKTDQLNSRSVVVINDAMARALFPNGDAVGRRIGDTSQPTILWQEIVGVVEDARALNIRPSPVQFQTYKPFTQEAWQYVTIGVRVADPNKAPTLLEPIRSAVATLDPEMPVLQLMTLTQQIDRDFGVWKTINQLLLLFGALGLLLVALGIYGVITRLITQRTREIGVRIALGAQVLDVVRLVLVSGLRMALLGTFVGGVGAIFLSRVISNALPAFGGSGDLLPLIIAGSLLVATAIAASWLPARRASKTDPITALRAE